MLRFHVVVNLTDFDAQVRLRGSWIFHRSFCNSNHPFRARPLSISMATDRQPLPQAFHRNFMFTETCLLQPPDIRYTTWSILHNWKQRIQTTKFPEILGFENEQTGKQTPKLKELVSSLFHVLFTIGLLVPIHNQDKPCFSDGTQFLQTHKDAGNVLPAMGQVLIWFSCKVLDVNGQNPSSKWIHDRNPNNS